MPRHKKGTMVRIKPNDESNWWGDSDTQSIVEVNGWLYIVERFQHADHTKNETGEDEYLCRSLSTGTSLALYPHETTTTKEKADANRTGPEA